MTRLDALPQPDLDEVPKTPRQVEIQGIRRRLSMIAARLTPKPERVAECTEAVRAELERLERLVKGGD